MNFIRVRAVALVLPLVAACSQAAGGAPSTSEAATYATPEGACAHPIVLHHGFMGSSDEARSIWAFQGVKEALSDAGNVVVASDVPPFQPVAKRAEVLGSAVRDAIAACKKKNTGAHPVCDPSKVHIIAHSMGGLDARVFIRDNPGKVATLTTISSPHAGTRVADVLVGLAKKVAAHELIDGESQKILDWAAKGFALTFTSPDLAKSDVLGALTDLTTAEGKHALGLSSKDDPQSVPLDPSVEYRSWAGVSDGELSVSLAACEGKFWTPDGMSKSLAQVPDTVNPLLSIPYYLTGGKGCSLADLGAHCSSNDGMATVTSAKAIGGFQGCIPADHLDEVGESGLPGVAAPSHVLTGFDHLAFYSSIARDLAAWELDKGGRAK